MEYPKITIYSLPSCEYCHMTKEYLKSKNIPFVDVDLLGNDKEIKHMVKISGQTATPVIDVNGQIIVGFQKNILDALLGF